VIQVAERQGALVWQAGADRFLVDPEGVVIAADPPDEQAGGLVTVQARDADPPPVGGRVDPATARTAVAVARWLAQGSPAPVAGLEYAPRTGLVLVGRDGWRVVLGDDARIEEKLAVTLALLKGERTWRTLDVTDPDRPFYK
jgi:Cell division protein FtsQ